MKKRAPFLAIAATSMLLAACGGGGSHAASSSTVAAVSSPASTSASPNSSSQPTMTSTSTAAPAATRTVTAAPAPTVTKRVAAVPAHVAVGSDGPDDQIVCESEPSIGPTLIARGPTTCPFARSVLAAAQANPNASTLQAYSPVTHKTYTMTKSTGAHGSEFTASTGADVWIEGMG